MLCKFGRTIVLTDSPAIAPLHILSRRANRESIMYSVLMEDSKDPNSPVQESDMNSQLPLHMANRVDHRKQRYPHCIVWTPIPLLT